MSRAQPFSFVRLALYALGAGSLVLLGSIPIILLLAQWSKVAALIAALLAVIGIVAAIGVVSQRIVGQAETYLKNQHDREGNEHRG